MKSAIARDLAVAQVVKSYESTVRSKTQVPFHSYVSLCAEVETIQKKNKKYLKRLRKIDRKKSNILKYIKIQWCL